MSFHGSGIKINADGLDEFSALLKEYERLTNENAVTEVLQQGADDFVRDLKALPQPKSKVMKGGYTHLIHTFASEKQGHEIEVGWGKYYGPMVERGTKRMTARPHLVPLFNSNKEKYYKKMIQLLKLR